MPAGALSSVTPHAECAHDAELAYAAVAIAVAVRGGRDAIAGVILHTDRAASTPPGWCGAPATGWGSASRWADPGRRWTTP